MNFPEWTIKQNGKALNAKAQAQARLRYLMNQLANETDPAASYLALAKKLKISHTTISAYIVKAAFSESCAARIEATFGKDLIKADWLVNPMNIKAGVTKSTFVAPKGQLSKKRVTAPAAKKSSRLDAFGTVKVGKKPAAKKAVAKKITAAKK